MITCSDIAGYNLIPRFRYWKWPYVNEVEPFVSKYNDWNNDANITNTWPGGLKVVIPVTYSESELYPLNNPSWTVTKTTNGVTTTEVCVEAVASNKLTIKAGCLLKVNEDASQPAGKVILNFANFTVAGKITFVAAINDITIKTKSLNIINGEFILGTPQTPYTGKLKIELQGTKTDPSMASFE